MAFELKFYPLYPLLRMPRELRKKHGLKLGDIVEIEIGNAEYTCIVVYGAKGTPKLYVSYPKIKGVELGVVKKKGKLNIAGVELTRIEKVFFAENVETSKSLSKFHEYPKDTIFIPPEIAKKNKLEDESIIMILGEEFKVKCVDIGEYIGREDERAYVSDYAWEEIRRVRKDVEIEEGEKIKAYTKFDEEYWLEKLHKARGPEDKIKVCEEALKINSEWTHVLFYIAYGCFAKKDMKNAEKYLKKITNIDPENADACAVLAQVYDNLGNLEKQEECLVKTLKLYEKKERVSKSEAEKGALRENIFICTATLGFCHHKLGNLEKAEEYYQKAFGRFKELPKKIRLLLRKEMSLLIIRLKWRRKAAKEKKSVDFYKEKEKKEFAQRGREEKDILIRKLRVVKGDRSKMPIL